jgi:hypothetical protein
MQNGRITKTSHNGDIIASIMYSMYLKYLIHFNSKNTNNIPK